MPRDTAFDDLLRVDTPARRVRQRTTQTRLDAWWEHLNRTPTRRRVFGWAGPVAVTLLAAVLRLWNLAAPRTLVFDETFYVKDAWSMVTLGYEGTWPDDPNPAFVAGDTDQFTTAPEFVVHPPLGKWIISLGMQAFGADSTFGWRISTAVVGILSVAIVCLIAYLLFRSPVLATIAGGLMAIDGTAIVMSRTALLDTHLLLFTLLGFVGILLDRGWSERRLDAWIARRRAARTTIDWGPMLWWRPWLISAGVMFGLATGVKWSGAYFLAGFAIYTLVVDALARRRAGVQFWASSAAVIQAPASFVLLVPTAVVAYVATWTGWLRTSGGYGRQWAADTTETLLPLVPLPLQSLWHNHTVMYNSNLSIDSPHAWASNPLHWLFLGRPTAFLLDTSSTDCGAATCTSFITSIPNPLLWFAAVAAAFYLLYRVIRFHEWKPGLLLMGVAVGYLPWLLYTERTVFAFYTIVFEPYLVLGLTLVLGLVLGRPTDSRWRRLVGIRLVAVFLVMAVLVSAFYWSEWTGLVTSTTWHNAHRWLPGW